MNKLEKEAARDAAEYLAAEMAYGEGSGTRRKLVYGPINQKMIDGDYETAFMAAYDRLDVDKFAAQAIKDHKNVVRAAKAGQNFRALKNGNMNNLTTGLFVVVGVGIVLHKTGYDKVLEKEAKVQWAKAKTEYRVWQARRKLAAEPK